jgi:serine protease AprX
MIAARFGSPNDSIDKIPVVLQFPEIVPKPQEQWGDYKTRVTRDIEPTAKKIIATMGLESNILVTANSLKLSASFDQINQLSEYGEVDYMELDQPVHAQLMDDALPIIEHDQLIVSDPYRDGRGVIVAVLDSGVDAQHQYLNVHTSVSTCGESTDIPGEHGTHCAGSVASQDALFPGVAPGVTLLNIKVLKSNGSGSHSTITQGIDEAIERGAHILSMSLGFNHRPTWSANGHGWSCPDGKCPLCTAVNNANRLDSTICVVAAGNEHQICEDLRDYGYGNTFDTELGCPGQAEEAITVAAITKNLLPASFSSRGPAAYPSSNAKPTISAPGVNITSTVPMPRDSSGNLIANPTRSSMFDRMSGTSMATPIVAGAVALILQDYIASSKPWTPQVIKNDLLSKGVTNAPFNTNVVGDGILSIKGI